MRVKNMTAHIARIQIIRRAATAAAMGLMAARLVAEEVCVTVISDPVTFYFGVETQDPDLFLVDLYHTDLGMPYVAGEWDFHVHIEDLELELEPDEALLYVNENARLVLDEVPPGYEFIGFTPGQPFWVLPQNPNPLILYLGIASEDMEEGDIERLCIWNPGDPRGGADQPGPWLRLQLLEVNGPAEAELSTWQAEDGPPTVFWSTFEGGLTDRDVYYGLAGGHGHVNWAFTKAGLYAVTLRAATLVRSNCPGDLDLNGRVDLSDLAILLADWGCERGLGFCRGDVDADGKTDLSDLATLLAGFGRTCD